MADSQLKETLKKFLATERISNSDFGRMTGTSASYVTSVKTSISFDMLAKIVKINPRLNLSWLILGTPPMYTDDHTAIETAQKEIAMLKEKVAMLQKIVDLYERNENGTTKQDTKRN